jgi:hypothetical protein
MAGYMACALPLAERKQIRILTAAAPQEILLTGDRELVEFAFYNLRPIPLSACSRGRRSRWPLRAYVSVEDQGIGMDQKEVDVGSGLHERVAAYSRFAAFCAVYVKGGFIVVACFVLRTPIERASPVV